MSELEKLQADRLAGKASARAAQERQFKEEAELLAKANHAKDS